MKVLMTIGYTILVMLIVNVVLSVANRVTTYTTTPPKLSAEQKTQLCRDVADLAVTFIWAQEAGFPKEAVMVDMPLPPTISPGDAVTILDGIYNQPDLKKEGMYPVIYENCLNDLRRK